MKIGELLKLDKEDKYIIGYEILQIDEMFKDFKPLLDLCKLRKPGFIEACAAGGFLESFYTGIEKTVIHILKANSEKVPNDPKWHTNLLEMAFSANSKGDAIFNSEHKDSLRNYMNFRHFFTHSYIHKLNIEKLLILFNNSEIMWDKIKNDINIYLDKQIINKVEPMDCYKHETNTLINDKQPERGRITAVLMENYGENTISGITYVSLDKYKLTDMYGKCDYVLQAIDSKMNTDNWYFYNDFNNDSALEFIKQWNEKY